MVVMVGIDVHKDTHCAVLVDDRGRPVGSPLTVRATDDGHRELLRWAAGRGSKAGERVEFAVEDCRHVSKRLEQALLTAGQVVWRVPPKPMSRARDAARTRGKSDPIDALAIARAALREPDLPRAEHTHSSRQLKLLVDHREDLVHNRTQAQNRLRWHLHDLDPQLHLPTGRTEAQFAMHAGVAPIPASSGRTDRFRLARGGNRQLNAALYRIAITQIRIPGPGQDYYRRRRAAGNTGPEAIRALKRRLARVVFNLLTTTPAGNQQAAA
jgi:transposase